MYRLLLLAIALIVYGSLYPWHFDFNRSGANPLWVLLHARPRGIDLFVLRDAAINLLLYFPLGVAALLAAARRHGRLVAFDAGLLIALGLSASMEMLQIYDPGRTCSLFDVLCNVSGAALALLLWSLLPERKRLAAGSLLLASAILPRELSPFRLAETPHPFSWIPFAATFDSERQSATVILLRKAFEYGALVWLFRTLGISYARAAVAVACSLAVLEAIQRYLPGRTPEITDSVVALLMALALWWLSSRAAPNA